MTKLSSKFLDLDPDSSDKFLETMTTVTIKDRIIKEIMKDWFFISISSFVIALVEITGVSNKIDSIKEMFADKFMFFLPEDYRGELQALRERWVKMNYSPQRIKWLNYKHIFLGFLCLIQVKIENLRLSKHGASKEIE